ncbi:MAG TPA: N-acetyl-gamma-glutamyl-phosphate reductase, partial [bacterium]|nr:N-acetyl-gamma-glutamyl-phosphate reductase [bacterium]
LVKNGIVEEEIIASSVSGVTGAGKKPSESNIFIKCNENIKAYKIGEHRHQPEIEEILNTLSGKNFNILSVPHIVPMNQGILSTCYLKLKKEISEDELCSIYKEFYKDEPFVRIMDYGISPSVKNVFDTNYCDIGFKIVDKNKVVVISAIDNLVKGASGQAVQNMNIMSGFCETIPFIK